MLLGEIVVTYPQVTEVLVEDYGLHCVGCFAAAYETLEQGAIVHGLNDKQIDEMVKKLNEIVSKTE